jgi:hypothetical protein
MFAKLMPSLFLKKNVWFGMLMAEGCARFAHKESISRKRLAQTLSELIAGRREGELLFEMGSFPPLAGLFARTIVLVSSAGVRG